MTETKSAFEARAVALNYTTPGIPQPAFDPAVYERAVAVQAAKIRAWSQPAAKHS